MKEWVKIVDCERLNNSVNGNPRYKVWVETKDKNFRMKTQSDGVVGYKFSHNMVGSAKFIHFHETKSGNYVMTDIEDSKKWTVWYSMGCSNDRYYFKDRETYKQFCREVFGYKDEDFMYDCERYVTCHYRDEERRILMHKLCNIVLSEKELMLGE